MHEDSLYSKIHVSKLSENILPITILKPLGTNLLLPDFYETDTPVNKKVSLQFSLGQGK